MNQEQRRKDFFISYADADKNWAEWITWILEQEGYSVFLKAWDLMPGQNIVLVRDIAMQQAKRTLVLLSPAALSSPTVQAEWASVFHGSNSGEQGRLIPIVIRPCDIQGMIGTLGYIDLVGLDENAAHSKLLEWLSRIQRRPVQM